MTLVRYLLLNVFWRLVLALKQVLGIATTITDFDCNQQPSFQMSSIQEHTHSNLFLSIITPRPLPQNILLNLPRTRLWQLLHNLHLPRHHKLRNRTLMLGPSNQILSHHLLTFFDGNESLRSFTPMRVCD